MILIQFKELTTNARYDFTNHFFEYLSLNYNYYLNCVFFIF